MSDIEPQRILIIDDNPDDAELAGQALFQMWQDPFIEVAATAERGIEKAKAASWSLILLDYKLPGKTGLEVLQELKHLSPESGIILLTGHGDEAMAVQVMLAGADYYLRKSTNFLHELPLAVRTVYEKRQLQLHVKHTEERFHRLIAYSIDIVFELDAHGCFRYVSPAAETILGYSPESLRGVPLVRFLHPDDSASYANLFQEQHMKHSASPAASLRFLTKGGEIREIEMNAAVIYDQGNRFSATVGMARDVTERKKAEASLARLHYQYELLLNSVHDGIYAVDLEGKALLVNPAAASILGYAPEELQGRFMHDIVHHSKPDGTPSPVEKCSIYQAFRDGKVHHVLEDVFWKRDGSCFWVEYTSNPIYEHDKITGAVVTFRDISDRKRSEERLRESHEQLRDLAAHLETVREEERTRVAREIHDELGSALTCLKMDLAWMAKRISPSVSKEDGAQLAPKIHSMSKFVNEMVQLVQKVTTELRPAVLDELGLGPAIEWQAKEFQGRTGMKCTLDITPESLAVGGKRATAIFRIFQEILTNVTRHASATKVCLSMKNAGEHLELQVTDNGRGITATQVSSPKSFGLVGMRERALLWGGEVTIVGQRHKGTTVTLRLPLNHDN